MNKEPHRVKILGAKAVKAKLRRMAYEIFEKNYEESDLVMIGMGKRGGYLASQLADLLHEISPLKVTRIDAIKSDSREGVLPEETANAIPGKVVVIVDDVLYSGLTMFHALSAVMDLKPAKVQIAVLIDRGHRHIPVSHDFVGVELATSLQQYVSVEIAENEHKAVAYLF
jgi:pyrimidine operon attenuation protein/uracil phosphoribosyltransferase